MKKFGMIFGGFIALLLVAVIAIPLFVDVDKYRPQIVQQVNDRIHGKLELGKLQLSLWGRILISIDGLKLKDSSGSSMVEVSDAYFHLPFTSAFSGSPMLTFHMSQPKISVVKDAKGEINLLNLMKPAASAAAPSETPGQSQGAVAAAKGDSKGATKESVAIPALVARARLGLDIRDAQLDYQDKQSGLKNQFRGLNLLAKDLSLTRKSSIELYGDIDTQMGGVFSVSGPFRIEAKLSPELQGQKFAGAQGDLKLNLDGLVIEVPGSFKKSKSIPAHLESKFRVNETSVQLNAGALQFHNASLTFEGDVTNQSGNQVKFQAKSNSIDLSKWNELLPSVEGLGLTGVMTLAATAQGPVERLNYVADLAIGNLAVSHPNFKAKPQFELELHLKTDQIEKIFLSMKAPGTDLKVMGQVASFQKPRFKIDVQSQSMDLDQWVKFPEIKSDSGSSASSSGNGAQGSSKSGASKGAASDAPSVDDSLGTLRSNSVARSASGQINISMKKLKAYGIQLTPIEAQMTLSDLVASLSRFSMGIFGGSISAQGSADLRPKHPSYRFSTKLTQLNLKQAVESQLQLFKNTFYGKMDFAMEGSGVSFDPAMAKGSLHAKGNLKVAEAVFATIDVGKMTQEAINNSLDKVANRVPQLKGKKLGQLPNVNTQYDSITATFSIKDGKFNSPDFLAKAKAGKGIDLMGSTSLNLLDESLNARWEIVDTYNLTKAHDLSVDIAGTNVPNVLAGSDGKVKFPVTVGCKATAPCYSYTEVPEYLAKVAMDNVTKAGSARLKKEAESKAREVIQKQAPAQLQKLFKGLKF